MSGFEPEAALTHPGDARRCTLDMGLGCWALLGPLTSAFSALGLFGASLFGFDFPTSLLELGELALGGLVKLLSFLPASLCGLGELVCDGPLSFSSD